jgi:hypothetical protein
MRGARGGPEETAMARKVFGEFMEGVEAMKKHREGKLTLRSYKVEAAPLPAVNSKSIRKTRRESCRDGAGS